MIFSSVPRFCCEHTCFVLSVCFCVSLRLIIMLISLETSSPSRRLSKDKWICTSLINVLRYKCVHALAFFIIVTRSSASGDSRCLYQQLKQNTLSETQRKFHFLCVCVCQDQRRSLFSVAAIECIDWCECLALGFSSNPC